MVELDLFRHFRVRAAGPSADAQRRASARLARAMEGEHAREERVGRSGRRRLFVMAAAALVVAVATASAFGTARDLFLGNAASHRYGLGALPGRLTGGISPSSLSRACNIRILLPAGSRCPLVSDPIPTPRQGSKQASQSPRCVSRVTAPLRSTS